jgi:hypothetical protein
MSDLVQHALVTGFALLALGVLVRRIVGLSRSARRPTACASCPLAARAGHPAATRPSES